MSTLAVFAATGIKDIVSSKQPPSEIGTLNCFKVLQNIWFLLCLSVVILHPRRQRARQLGVVPVVFLILFGVIPLYRADHILPVETQARAGTALLDDGYEALVDAAVGTVFVLQPRSRAISTMLRSGSMCRFS